MRNLNAFLHRQGSSCPLKLSYYSVRDGNGTSGIAYKSETGIMLRRALSLKYPGGLEAAKDHETAIVQTADWLKAEDAIVYGGVVAWKNCHARLPIVIKSLRHITLLQLHGKVWKSHSRVLNERSLDNNSMIGYLRDAAYKKWILSQFNPELEITIRLCFPNPLFHAPREDLYGNIAYGESGREDTDSLFIEVNADEAVEMFMQSAGEMSPHPFFRGKSFTRQIEWMADEVGKLSDELPFMVTDACSTCSFRSGSQGSVGAGCWETHMNGDFRYPGRHTFDLIGHGNDLEAGKNNYLQEEVSLPSGILTFEDVIRSPNRTITIQQRRSLQLLSAKDRPLPVHWLKKGLLENVRKVTFPLHFIDFEAATMPIPMKSLGKPYKPVYFQFSCHSLFADGTVKHHEWLDRNIRGYPHTEFIQQLAAIPGIDDGMIVQYSPFEKQALNRLRREMNEHPEHKHLADRLSELLKGSGPDERFLDMNNLVRDFYFNREMHNGLGLKPVLRSTLQTSPYLRELYRKPVVFDGGPIRLVKGNGSSLADPYSLIQGEEVCIDEGSSAMHAWLHAKTPFCDNRERKQIYKALSRYCTLDSLALVMIFQHWMNIFDKNGDENADILVWDS